jgi:type IV secretion system protein VirB6
MLIRRDIVMNETPFETIASSFSGAFHSGVSNAINQGLAAVAGPVTALVVLWIIIQGILVMRGDVDTRQGITRIIKVSLVVGLLTGGASYYTEYVVTLFQTTLPDWAASVITPAGGVTSANAPQTFDKIWNTAVHQFASVQYQISWYDIVDAVTLCLVEFGVNIVLFVTFAIYEVGQVMTGVAVAIGPFVLAGYLFDATKGVAERWVGKLVGLALLSILIDIVLSIILSGENTYVGQVAIDANGGTVGDQIQTLIEMCMFMAIGAFIAVGLPGVAAALGGSVGFSGQPVARNLTGVMLGGARAAVRPLAPTKR